MRTAYTLGLLALLSTGCAGTTQHAKRAGVVLAVSVDKTTAAYVAAKEERLALCKAQETTEQGAIECMGVYHGDKVSKALEIVVKAQEAMTEAIEAMEIIESIVVTDDK